MATAECSAASTLREERLPEGQKKDGNHQPHAFRSTLLRVPARRWAQCRPHQHPGVACDMSDLSEALLCPSDEEDARVPPTSGRRDAALRGFESDP